MAPTRSKSGDRGGVVIHATTVAFEGRGLVISGPSGSGKSSLALHLMAFGCALVSDDKTRLSRIGDRLIASAPDEIDGLIEARGVGLLKAAPAGPTPVCLAVDMGKTELARLPEPHQQCWLGMTVPSLHKIETPHFTFAVLQYLRHGRRNP